MSEGPIKGRVRAETHVHVPNECLLYDDRGFTTVRGDKEYIHALATAYNAHLDAATDRAKLAALRRLVRAIDAERTAANSWTHAVRQGLGDAEEELREARALVESTRAMEE